MRFYLALFIVFMAFAPTYSQSDFRAGFVVTNLMDTVQGFVQYSEGGKATRKCNFKSSAEASKITYLPGQILGYGYKDERYYESKKIEIDQDSSILFLEIVVSGAVRLFVSGNRIWVEKQNSGLVELKNDPVEVNLNDVAVVRRSNQYIATLNMILEGCSSLRDVIQGTRFNEKSLTNVVDLYNKCSNSKSIVYKDNRPKFKLSIGISGGIQNSEINFDSSFDYLIGDFETPVLPFGGITFDLFSPRLSERVSISSSFFYTKSNYYRFSEDNRVGTVNKDYVTIQLKQLKIPFGIKYRFSGKSTTPYITGGLAHTFHLKSNSEWIDETVSTQFTPYRVSSTVGEALPIRSSQWGFFGGIGLVTSIKKKLNAALEFRNEWTNGIVDKNYQIPEENHLYSNITNFQIILSLSTK
jgi:hypothetical protein